MSENKVHQSCGSYELDLIAERSSFDDDLQRSSLW
jgi:hypothetical protein